MTKKQVHDALWNCGNKTTVDVCRGCPYEFEPLCRSKLMSDAAALLEETAVYDEVEEHRNCTVQILHNSKTGEYSVGWRRNND